MALKVGNEVLPQNIHAKGYGVGLFIKTTTYVSIKRNLPNSSPYELSTAVKFQNNSYINSLLS